jgi:hypothetical protein
MADAQRPRSMSLPPEPPRTLEHRVIALEFVKSRLIDDLEDLVSETKNQSVMLTTIQSTLARIETERQAEKEHKKWWDSISRGVMIALIVALTGWVAHIAMVTQTARLPP